MLPTSIKIGPYKYGIIRVDNLTAPDGDSAWGYFSVERARIEVASQVTNQQTLQMILMHEIIHTMIDMCEFKMPIEQEEDLVSRLTPVLLAFIKENPKVVKYLT